MIQISISVFPTLVPSGWLNQAQHWPSTHEPYYLHCQTIPNPRVKEVTYSINNDKKNNRFSENTRLSCKSSKQVPEVKTQNGSKRRAEGWDRIRIANGYQTGGKRIVQLFFKERLFEED